VFAFYFAFPAEYCLPLVRVGGLFIAAKGHDPEVYVTAIKQLFFQFIHNAFNIPSSIALFNITVTGIDND